MMSFTSDVSLLIFCPDDVSIEESGVYKSPITDDYCSSVSVISVVHF